MKRQPSILAMSVSLLSAHNGAARTLTLYAGGDGLVIAERKEGIPSNLWTSQPA